MFRLCVWLAFRWSPLISDRQTIVFRLSSDILTKAPRGSNCINLHACIAFENPYGSEVGLCTLTHACQDLKPGRSLLIMPVCCLYESICVWVYGCAWSELTGRLFFCACVYACTCVNTRTGGPLLERWEGSSSRCDNLLKAVTLKKGASLAVEGGSFIITYATADRWAARRGLIRQPWTDVLVCRARDRCPRAAGFDLRWHHEGNLAN